MLRNVLTALNIVIRKAGGGRGESGVGIIWAIRIDIYTIDTMYKIGN